MKKVYFIIILLLLSIVVKSQLPEPTGPHCIKVKSIYGFYDCTNINDSTCVKIPGTNGVLMKDISDNYFNDLNYRQEWVYAYDITNLNDFIMPENQSRIIKDTTEIVAPTIPIVKDYAGYMDGVCDSIVCYMIISSWDTIKPINPEYENIGIKRTKTWILKNDRSVIPPKSLNIEKINNNVIYKYTFIDCFEITHYWTYTYIFENLPPHIIM